jgi:REP element-mobilizing transposase RayT
MITADQLPLFRPRGGRRAGAGAKPGPRPRVRHGRRPPITGRQAGHVTLKVREGLRSLRDLRIVRELEQALRGAAERGDFRLVHYTIQADHLHLIVEAADRKALGRGMTALASRVARAVNRVLGRTGPVLRDRYHLRVLRTPLEVRRALAYVLLNARKHLGRLAPTLGRIDPASSGAWFDGWRRLFEPPEERPPPVAPARSWLLRVGVAASRPPRSE